MAPRRTGVSKSPEPKPVDNTRVAPPDTRWHYASSETEILGLVLRTVTGKPVADYLGEKIWQRIATEADAS